ncbi:expressed protein, partial [Phakopsora pachyrhizi]
KVRRLTRLSPFLTRGKLIVTPLVFFITDQTLVPKLNRDEVEVLFSHPLETLANQTTDHLLRLAPIPGSRLEIPYRFFEFPSKRSPIAGFTADVLIEVATIAYGREPFFERRLPGQIDMRKIIGRSIEECIEFELDEHARLVNSHDLLEEQLIPLRLRVLFLKAFGKRWIKTLKTMDRIRSRLRLTKNDALRSKL